MSTVLVTGATGFVGDRVVRRLRERGDQVIALVRRPTDELADLGVDQRLVALQDLEAVQRAGENADAIVHAAATAGPDLATATEVNVDGTRAVAGAALLAGLRFVHVSTTSVYDLAAVGDARVDEDAPLVRESSAGTPSPYALTKARAEDEVDRALRNGLCATILRPPAVLGAGPTSTWGTHVPRSIRDGEPLRMGTEQTFGWVHVDDLCDAILGALDADAEVARGVVANVVGGHVTFGEYRDAVVAFLGDVPPPPPEPEQVWRGRYATDRLPAVLDVRPSRSFDDAMADIAASWREGDPDA